MELENSQVASSTKLQIREIQLRQVASLLGLELVGTAKGRLNLAELKSRAISLTGAGLAQSQSQTSVQTDTIRPRLTDF